MRYKKKIRAEIIGVSAEADKPILLWLLDRYTTAKEWELVAFRDRLAVLNGPNGGGFVRLWEPTRTGRVLYRFAMEHPDLEKRQWPDKSGAYGRISVTATIWAAYYRADPNKPVLVRRSSLFCQTIHKADELSAYEYEKKEKEARQRLVELANDWMKAAMTRLDHVAGGKGKGSPVVQTSVINGTKWDKLRKENRPKA